MIKPRALLLLTTFCIASALSMSQAKDPNVSAREEGDNLISAEARRSALNTLLAEAERFRQSADSLSAARSLNRAGHLQLKLNLPNDALTTFQEALEILNATPTSPTSIDALNGLAAAYNRLSKCDQALVPARTAIAQSDENQYPAGKAEALLTTSDCQNFSDHALAIRTAQEALSLWQSIGDKRGVAETYAALAYYQLAQSDLSEAVKSNEAALNLWRELNVPSEQAEALINLGFIEYRKGDWQTACVLFTQAQGLLDEKAEPYKMGQIAAGLANAFIESGLPENGLVKYEQALAYYRESQNPQGVIVMTWGIGRTHYLLGHNSEAIDFLERGLREAQAVNRKNLAALCEDYLGRTYEALGDLNLATVHFLAALEISSAADPAEAARVRALLGLIYQRQGDFEKARQYQQKALEVFQSLSDRVNQSATLYALGRLELKSGNYDAAENYLRQSISVTEDIRRVSTSRDLTTAFSATVHDRYESYVDCLMRKHRAQPTQRLDVRAFEISEQGRGRALAELLRATQTNPAPGVDAQLAEQEKSLRQSLRIREDEKVALLGKAYKKEDVEALDAELARLNAEFKRINETISARYPSYTQITQPTSWDLRQIQEQILADDQTVLLEYSLGADHSYVWAVTRSGIAGYELPPQSQITEAANRLYKLLKTPPEAGGANELAAAQELARMVLSPVAAQLNKHRIIVVADGALNYIPFQVLPAPATGNEPLIANYEVINAPSASILGQLRQETARRMAPEKVLAAFGDPVFASNYAERKDPKTGDQVAAVQSLENGHLRHSLRDVELNGDSFDPSVIKPLAYARRELAVLRDIVPAGETFVAADFEATRERLQGTDLTKFAILHFATHGFLDPKRPEHSGLVLSTVNRAGQEQNGFVELQDIYNLHAPVDLVVLSACQTALGKDVRGEGLIGLTRGFMYAGASSVVASLWKVDDEATAELMKQFYTNLLQKGMRPAEALRAAQDSIRQKPEWRAPYYWAAFTLQGEYRQVIRPAHSNSQVRNRNIVLGGSLLLLLLSAAWWYRRRRGLRAA